MNPVRATFSRTVGRARSLVSTSFSIVAFLSLSSVLLARAVEAAEGGVFCLSVLWATSVSPVLPALAALLGMEVWSDERQSGRIDALLTVAVRERDFVLGKFLGVWTLLALAVGLSLLTVLLTFRFLAPDALVGSSAGDFALACAALLLQGLLWSAVSVSASAVFRHAATAATASFLALVALPRGLWLGLVTLTGEGRTAFGEMPLDAHVIDIASGLVPIGTVVIYLVLTALALFVATKCVALYRLVGHGASGLRASTALAIALAVLLGVLSAAVFVRVNPTAELAFGASAFELSERTRHILSETSGSVTVTSFVSRTDPAARPLGRLLRALKRLSESVGGARIDLRFVDPRWDVGAAERLVRRGAGEQSVVFEKGRRIVSVPASEGLVERVCVSTIRRVCTPPRRHTVFWTTGHGEKRFDDYGTFGMSDIARDLFREGFSNAEIDLASGQPIPADCALILIAGAKNDFSRAEADRLNGYLQEGGRLLVLLDSAKAGGVVSLLPSWGLRPVDRTLDGARTLTGTDVIVSEFTEHPVSAPLKGSRVVLERPTAFVPSAVADGSAGVDRIGYSSVAAVGDVAVAAAIERGGGAGADLALRPTRIVALGDVGLVDNGQLLARANANRDLFMNSVFWLSGGDVYESGEIGQEVFTTGLDRRDRLREMLVSAVVVPLAVFVVLFAVTRKRRRRS